MLIKRCSHLRTIRRPIPRRRAISERGSPSARNSMIFARLASPAWRVVVRGQCSSSARSVGARTMVHGDLRPRAIAVSSPRGGNRGRDTAQPSQSPPILDPFSWEPVLSVGENQQSWGEVSRHLETHPDFPSLKPHLSQDMVAQIYRPTQVIVGTTIPSTLSLLYDEIARIEKEWGLG